MQQGKDFEYLYATRRDHRIRICVTRIAKIDSPADYRFVATCSVGGRVHRCFGHVPSQAVGRLITQLSHAVSRLDFERNMIASGRVAA